MSAMAGIVCEMVNLGSTRIGLPRYENGLPQGHEPNEWCLQPEEVFVSGYLVEEDLAELLQMCNKTKVLSQSSMLLPGISFVYLDENDALKEIRNSYRNEDKKTIRVLYKIRMDNEKGIPNYVNTSNGWNLRTCFNTFKLTSMMGDTGRALAYRLLCHVRSFQLLKS